VFVFAFKSARGARQNVLPQQPVAELIRSFCREQNKNLDGTACEDMNMGVDALSSAAPAKTATQNRNRSSKSSAESPCRPRGVPLPSSFRMTSERLNPPT